MVRLVSFFVALFFLSSCAGNIREVGPLAPSACSSRDFGLFAYGTQFDAVSVDSKTSRFPTRYVIQSEDLTVNKEFPLERYKQRLYVMVVDAGRREFIPPTSWQIILGISSRRTFVAGYDGHFLSIDKSWRA